MSGNGYGIRTNAFSVADVFPASIGRTEYAPTFAGTMNVSA
jgi:hypothetical protein